MKFAISRFLRRLGRPRFGRSRADALRRRLSLDAMEDRTLLTTYGFLTGPNPGAPLDIALGYLAQHGAEYGVAPADLGRLAVTDMYTDTTGSKATHIYLRQGFEGLQVDGAELGVHVTPRGEIIAISGSFVPGLADRATGAVPVPRLSATDALMSGATALGIVFDAAPTTKTDPAGVDRRTVLDAPGISFREVPAHLEYVATAGGARLAWDFVIYVKEPEFQVYNASVDADTGALLNAPTWVDHFNDGSSYNVYALPNGTPNYAPRAIVSSPSDTAASPFGWHDTNGQVGPEFTDTRGNNVDAFVDVNATFGSTGPIASPSRPRPDGGSNLRFDFPLNLGLDPSAYADAATSNLFYVNNVLHDVHFKYGFGEAANFQVRNYSGQGLGNDPLLAVESFGFNLGFTDNAFMFTPPDGQSPLMGMFLWDLTSPLRSGGLDAEVIVHEFGHGVSNRLTGGPSNSGALNANQSGSMGEGWSDWWSLLFTQGAAAPTATTRRSVGTYVLGQPQFGAGIRRFPYSFDKSVDPLTLGAYNGGFPNNEVHNAGEIWTSVLWDMTVLLVQKYGYNPNLALGYTGEGSAGNILALQLVADGLKLQPANPSFLQARDAILRADFALTGGENQAEIWRAFARRGFGVSASDGGANSNVVTEAFDEPAFPTLALALPAGARENTPLPTQPDGVRLGTLVDASSPLPSGGYQVTVDYGDGTVVPGTLVATGGGNFDLFGPAKTYQEGGRYSVKVTVVKPNTIKLVVRGTLDVADEPITGTGIVVLGREGDSFRDTIARFSDADVDVLPPEVYSVTIFWGDDNTQSPGLVEPDPVLGPRNFLVKGDHVFAGGQSDIVVQVVGPGGSRANIVSRATIADSPLSSTGFEVSPVEGTPYILPLARFFDEDPRRPTADNYFASIDWGDGTVTNNAAIAPDFVNGGFLVSGDHAYEVGDYVITITVGNRTGDSTTVATANAIVSDAPITATGFDFTASVGRTFNNFLATFVDADPRRHPASRYVTSIDWGDGSPAVPGVVQANIDGGYLLRGPHAYRLPGTYTYRATIADGVGGFTTVAEGTIVVPPAPISARIETQARPTEGQGFTGVIASFTSANPLATAGDFRARIDWGDGTATDGARITFNAATGRFEVSGGKAYQAVGRFGVSVVVTGPGGQQAAAGGSIDVADAPITATGVPVSLESKTDARDVVVANFRDADPTPRIGDFTATIVWGDGTESAGRIVANPAGGFDVVGSHSYGRSGSFPISATVVSRFGSRASAGTTAVVTPRTFALTGGLVGAGAATGVTSSATPTFSGQAEPGATVVLMAVPAGTSTFIPLAQTTADASGRWQATSVPLGDGTFAVAASAVDANGDPSSPLTVLQPTPSLGALVVDTQGPRVQQVVVDPRTGQVRVTLADGGSGLDFAGLADAGNFSLSVVGGRTNRVLRVSGLTISPAAPNTLQTATLSFAGLTKLNRGNYVLTISAPGVTDLAGNALDERFFIPFPGLYTRSGQNFVAQFSSDGRLVSALTQFVPPPEVDAAQRYRQFLRDRLRRARR